MIQVPTIIAAVLSALIAIFIVVRISMAITDRKTNAELKKRRPDASNIHQDSGMVSG